MTVRELYERLSHIYPASLSCEWDNDGLLCAPAPNAEVVRVLCTLDVTEAAIAEAVRVGANVILSHHPLIFHPLHAITPDDPVAGRVMSLLSAGIAHMAFHTRADAAEGGVNDLLALALGLSDVMPFGDGLGRIGSLTLPTSPAALARRAAVLLDAPGVLLGDAGRDACRVAVVGGSGKSEIDAALAAGADTLLTGRLSYELINEAREIGINLIEAGHFYTEALLPRSWVEALLPSLGIAADYYHSCAVTLVGRDELKNV